MTLQNITVSTFIYLIAIWGIIDFGGELKTSPAFVLHISLLVIFLIQLFKKTRLKKLDIIIFILALLSSTGLALFISDIIIQPVAVAIDCEGHKPSRVHYFDIMFLGLILTFIIGMFFVKNRKHKSFVDRMFSVVIILVLALSFIQIPTIDRINKNIDAVSTPIYELPEGC